MPVLFQLCELCMTKSRRFCLGFIGLGVSFFADVPRGKACAYVSRLTDDISENIVIVEGKEAKGSTVSFVSIGMQ
jgi:hypothetical protein